MKKLFTAIRQNDLATVRQLLLKNPDLIACTAKQPPKKDDGQSPLQVALKTGHFDIVDYLLDCGADVNFIEDNTCCNHWRAPVIHDAINAAVMSSRWNVNSEIYGGLKVANTKEKADRAYGVLKRMVEKKSDTNALDSFGNSCLCRACLQARQILPSYNHAEHKLNNDRVLTEELVFDLSRIFRMLLDHGANNDYVAPNFGRTLKEMYRDEPLEQFLV